MTYTAFADNKPTVDTNGLQVVDDTRNNLMAMRDAVVMGAMAGWNYTPSGGTAEEPATLTYSKGVERLRATLTWSGGNVTQALWSHSSDSGSTFDTIGTETITYDAGGNVIAVSWS